MSVQAEYDTPFITTAALVSGEYDNTERKYFHKWSATNHAALVTRYEALGRAMPSKDDTDSSRSFSRAQGFLSFALCQFDIARGIF